MKSGVVKVVNEVGLHARPAVLFVKEVSHFKSRVMVRNLTTSSNWCTANSLIRLLTLGIERDHDIEIQTEGEDEELALCALVELIKADFPNS